MDREVETGEAVSCAASLDGVPLRPDGDGEACWRGASSGMVSFHDADGIRLKTLSFGPETGKTTAPLAAEVAHVRKVRPDAGRRRRARQPDVSREARRAGSRFLSRLRTSRRSCQPSRSTGTTAPPCATRSVDKIGTISATRRRRKRRFSSARFFRRHRRRLREPQGQGLHAPASSTNKVLVNQRMKRARWSVDGGQNVLTFKALSGRAAWRPERAARTTA